MPLSFLGTLTYSFDQSTVLLILFAPGLGTNGMIDMSKRTVAQSNYPNEQLREAQWLAFF